MANSHRRRRGGRNNGQGSTGVAQAPADGPVQATTTSAVRLHEGQVLWKLSNYYNNLPLMLVEMIQNAIDAEAKRIFIGIDLKSQRITIADDGKGASEEQFLEALASIGHGIKERDKLGRFGLGLISPLNKCTRFTFSSKVDGFKANRWTFVGETLKAMHNGLHIPIECIGQMPALIKSFRRYATGDWDRKWRTMVNMFGVDMGRATALTDLEEFDSMVRNRLGIAMRQKSVSVRVVLLDTNGVSVQRDIDPIQFTGEPFEIFNYEAPTGAAGKIMVQLFRAPRRADGKRDGQVLFMEYEDNYGVSIKDVVRQLRGGDRWATMYPETIRVLSSGFFQGIVRCSGITLDPTREKFLFNEGLLDLFDVLESVWFQNHGKQQFEDEEEQARETRYQNLGNQSLEALKKVLPDSLKALLKSTVEIGRLGTGHAPPSNGVPDGIEEGTSLRSDVSRVRTPRDPDTDPRVRKEPEADRPKDVPTGSYGPNGRHRQLIAGDSEGLWFSHDALRGDLRLWQFDIELGILTFNTRHHLWVKLDETRGRHLKSNERMILELQEWLALEVLFLLAEYTNPRDFEEHRLRIDDKIEPYVTMAIINRRR